MKARKVRVEFVLDTDRPIREIKKDVRYCFDRQFGAVSSVKVRVCDIPSDLILTFYDLIPHLRNLRLMVSGLKDSVKHQGNWDNAVSLLDEFEMNLDLSLR